MNIFIRPPIGKDDQSGPWSVNENGRLMFNDMEYKVIPSRLMRFLKINPKTAEIKNLANTLNKDYKAGLTDKKTIKVGRFIGKRFEVLPPELLSKYGQIAFKAGISPLSVHEVLNLAKSLVVADTMMEPNPIDMEKMIKALSAIPKEDRRILAETAMPIIKTVGHQSYEKRIEILEKMHSIIADLPDLPFKERTSLLQKATGLALKYDKFEDKVQLLGAISNLPSYRRNAAILDLAAPFVEVCKDVSNAQRIMEFISTEHEKPEYVQLAKTVVSLLGIEEAEIFNTLELVRYLPSDTLSMDNIESAVKDAKPLLEGSYSSELTVKNKVHILMGVNRLPPEGKDDLIKQLVPLMSLYNKGSFVRMLFSFSSSDIPLNERQDILRHVMPLLANAGNREEDTSDIVKEIIKIIQGTPQEKRGEVSNFLLPILQSPESTYEKFAMLQTLSQMPLDRIASIMQDAKPLLEIQDNLGQKAAILGAFVRLPAEGRIELVEYLLPLLRTYKSIEGVSLLNTIAQLPMDDRQDILRHAMPVLQQHTDRAFEIITAIQNIPLREREQVMNCVSPLLQNVSPDSVRTLITLVKGINSAEREEIVAITLRLLGENTQGLDKELILSSVIGLGSGRQAVLQDAGRLVEFSDTFLEKADILKAVARLPAEGRKELVEYLLPLLLTCDSSERVSLLDTIAQLPMDDRQDILRHAVPILEQHADRAQEIITEIQNTPQQEREQVMNCVSPLLQDILSFNVKSLISIVRGINSADREECVATTISLLGENQSNTTSKMGILVAVNRLGSERQAVLQHANRLMAQFPVHIDRLSLLTTLLLVPAERRIELIDLITPFLQQNVIASEVNIRMRQLANERFWLSIQIRSPARAPMADFGLPTDALRVEIARQDIKNNPLEVLGRLAEQLHEKAVRQLSVEFIGEAGIDASGLGREYMSSVMFETINKLNPERLDNGLVRQLPMQPGEEKRYNQLGEVMMFCLNSTREYPLGMNFDPGVFAILTKLKPEFFERSFDDIVKDDKGFEALLDIYVSMEGVNEKERENGARLKKYGQPFTENTDIRTLREVYFSGCNYDDERGLDVIEDEVTRDPSILKNHLPALQASVRESLTQEFLNKLRPILPPIIEIAKGMKASRFTGEQDTTFETVQSMKPDELSEKIQGRLTQDLVLEKLEFAESIPKAKRDWFIDWIKKSDLEKIKNLVFAMTGAYAIGSKNLKIKNGSENVYFHTCFNFVDIPFDIIQNRADFDVAMAGALASQEKYTRA